MADDSRDGLNVLVRVTTAAGRKGGMQRIQFRIIRRGAEHAPLGNDERLKGSNLFTHVNALVFGMIQIGAIFAWRAYHDFSFPYALTSFFWG